jgi:site-specific recombinase XerD
MTTALAQPPKTAKFSKPPQRQRNAALRTREYLTTHEVEQLRKTARQIGRHGHRDDTLILMLFRHGLRVSEAIQLKWEQVDFKQTHLHVKRMKNGKPATHPLQGITLRALRKLQREYTDSPYLFISERGAPLTARTAHHIVTRAGKLAALPFPVHPHMLRHGTGFYLANKGCDTRVIQHYLGHANIKNTVIYTELSPQRFKDLWED